MALSPLFKYSFFMKAVFNITLFIFLFFNNSHSQTYIVPEFMGYRNYENVTSLDSGVFRMLYAMNAVDVNNVRTYDDLQRLEIGAKMSKYYSFSLYNSDSLKINYLKDNPTAPGIPTWMGERVKKSFRWDLIMQSFFYKDFSKKVLTVFNRMPLGVDACKYSEDIPAQEWELQKDTLTVCGYLCQKATCHFRGRDFVAWFTPEIPIPNGPWKFGGLPGLILKVTDSEKMFDFECVKIENHTDKYSIILFDDSRFQKTDRAKVMKLVKDIHEDYYKVANMKRVDGLPYVFTPIPYHPLEKE